MSTKQSPQMYTSAGRLGYGPHLGPCPNPPHIRILPVSVGSFDEDWEPRLPPSQDISRWRASYHDGAQDTDGAVIDRSWLQPDTSSWTDFLAAWQANKNVQLVPPSSYFSIPPLIIHHPLRETLIHSILYRDPSLQDDGFNILMAIRAWVLGTNVSRTDSHIDTWLKYIKDGWRVYSLRSIAQTLSWDRTWGPRFFSDGWRRSRPLPRRLHRTALLNPTAPPFEPRNDDDGKASQDAPGVISHESRLSTPAPIPSPLTRTIAKAAHKHASYAIKDAGIEAEYDVVYERVIEILTNSKWQDRTDDDEGYPGDLVDLARGRCEHASGVFDDEKERRNIEKQLAGREEEVEVLGKRVMLCCAPHCKGTDGFGGVRRKDKIKRITKSETR